VTSRILTVVGTLLVVVGLLLIVRADDGLVRERKVVAGLPVTTLQPDAAGTAPAVIISHGFAASGRLMDGLAIALARDGWLAVVPDHAGHGANHDSLGDADLPGEVTALVEAVRIGELTGNEAVDTVTLLGHSMGAGATTQAATDLGAPVVALSLPSAEDLSGDLTAFFAVGRFEPSRFVEETAAAGGLGYPVTTIDGAEHISILFRAQTLDAVVAWLAPFADRDAAPAAADTRLAGVGAVYLGSALLFWPVSAVVTRHRERVSVVGGGRLPSWIGLPVAGLVAGLVLAAVPTLGTVVPLLVGGYLAAFFALTGLAALALVRHLERPSRAALPGLLMGVLVVVVVAVPAQLAWAEVSLSGVRGLSVAALAVAFLTFSWAELMLAGGYVTMLVGRLLLVAVLAALAVVGAAPGFLTLLVPLVALLLPWFGAYGVRMRQLTGSPLAGALAQAPSLALLVAVTTPLA
jgi:pimeloyl-ACP methyl ester carboxylesterase